MAIYQTFKLGDLTLTDYPFSVEFGGDKGSPESVTDVVAALLADGDVVVRNRAGNRSLQYVVGVEGTDFLDLARNEALLVAECEKSRNELGITPGDEFGPTTVFETQAIELRPIESDSEHSALYHRWELTIPALPFGRSAGAVVAEPLAVGETDTTIVFDTCDSVTGWTADIDGIPETPSTIYDSGSVGVIVYTNPDGDADILTMTRTGSVDFTGTPYLIVDKRNFNPFTENLRVFADGVELGVVDSRLMSGSRIRYVFRSPMGTVSSLAFKHGRSGGDTLGMLIYELSRSTSPSGTTSRQASRIIPVGGTQRTPGSLRVASGSGLGFTVIHTSHEDGYAYSPPMRQWRARGNAVVPDSTCISGAREKIHPEVVAYEIPAANVPPDGYTLGAWMKASATGSVRIFWASHTIVDGEIRGVVLSNAAITFTAGVWQFVEFPELLTLPTVAVKSSSDALVHVSLQRNPDPLVTVDVELDELWLFREGDGSALTIIETGDKTHLWLDSADIDSAVPRVWIGNAEDQSDAHSPGGYRILARGQHDFTPPASRVYVASSTGLNPAVRLTHHNRWHTNAAD